MSNQQANTNEKQQGKGQQGAGTNYHKEHAGSVPGYGNNTVDQIQKG